MKQVALKSQTRTEQRAIQNELARRRAEDNIGPTPETIAKLRPNNIDTLRRDDVIDDAQEADLHRIARAVQMIAAPVGMRTAGRMFIDHGRSDSPLSEYDLQCLVWYQKWWDELVRQYLQKAWTICYDVAVEGMSLREIEAARKCGRRTIRGLLESGLHVYSEVKRNR